MMEEKDRAADAFGEKLSEALRDDAACRRLPPDFLRRLLFRIPDPRTPNRRPHLNAAAIWLALGLGAFAATFVVGRAILNLPDEPGDEAASSSATAASITNNQGENNMIMARKVAALAGAAVLTVSAPGAKLSSEPTFVFLRPETSSFWNTATNGTMTLPIDFPSGATRASLRVTGLGYEARYDNIVASEFELTLPTPDSPHTENVYDLVLTFDNGQERRAKLGLIQGLDSGGRGRTRCLAPANGRVWNKVRKRAVLPIPYGMTSFKVNNVEVDPGLGGAQGWYALGQLKNGDDVSLSMIANGLSFTAALTCVDGGTMVVFH